MGFMDKAKKMAEQAQEKLDEAQKQFNERQGSSGAQGTGSPAVDYDKHGRPIPAAGPQGGSTPPQGDPLAAAASPPSPGVPPVADAPPPSPGVPPVADAPPPAPPVPPAGPSEPAQAQDRNHPSYAPPKLSGGDPLSGA